MQPDLSTYTNIDEYIAQFPAEIQAILEKVRETIHQAAPEAEETIKYRMPTFTLKGNLVHFAAHAKHIGFYPTPSGIDHFKDELTNYECSKGAIQFPLEHPIPYDLISRITKFRVQENLTAAKVKGKQK